MSGILGILGSLLSGGVTGILGAAVQRYADYKNKQQDIELAKLKFSQEVELRRLDAEMADKEWQGRLQVTNIEAEARKDVADSEAFKEAMWKEPDRYSKPSSSGWFTFLDVFRGIVRPGLTIYLCALTTVIYLEAKMLIEMYGTLMSVNQAYDIYSLIINTILYLTSTAVLFWFATRNKAKQPGSK